MRLEPEFLLSFVRDRAPSTAFAISLLKPNQRAGARALFAFTQIGRDAVNQAASRHEAQHAVAMLARLFEFGIVQRYAADHSIIDTVAQAIPDFTLAWEAWSYLEEDFEVPRAYANEFISGLKLEAEGYRPESVEDLLRYTYRTGGVVGVMACHILGLDEASQQPAVDLASSSRLHCLANNVYRDFTLGRNFAPLAWVPYATGQTFATSWASLSARRFKSLAKTLEVHARPGLGELTIRQRLAVSIGLALNRESRSNLFRKVDRTADDLIRLFAESAWTNVSTKNRAVTSERRRGLPVRDVATVLRNQKLVTNREL